MITIGNEVNYNFLNMSSGDGWEGFVAMSKISKMIREEGIKPAVSVSAPTTDASDIQWIIGKLGNADVDYDYIGVNIYPNTHSDSYVKELKNTAEISDMCHKSEEPIYVTKNGYGDMVIMSMENYENTMNRIAMYHDIEISEQQIRKGQVRDARISLQETRGKYGL